jgi:hypothetical protein
MPADHFGFEFRLEVLSPVYADSPFESGTFWGRIVSALLAGADDERALGAEWLAETAKHEGRPSPEWQPPLLVSEGFQCDATDEPWLPVPYAIARRLQKPVKVDESQTEAHEPRSAEVVPAPSRKDVKKVTRVPFGVFREMCAGREFTAQELVELREREPEIRPSLQPHQTSNRALNTGIEGLLYMLPLHIYSPLPKQEERLGCRRGSRDHGPQQIVFLLRLRDSSAAKSIESALRRVCSTGWGHAKARGLGHIRFKSFTEAEITPPATTSADGFVSLSYFCPAQGDPTDGYWKVEPKHPVPAQFIDGRRIALGEGEKWRVKSVLRLTPGSCFRLTQEQALRECYGRMLSGLLEPAQDSEGSALPALFHYALAYPWPLQL